MNILICYNFNIYKGFKRLKKSFNIQFYIYFNVGVGGCVVEIQHL